MFLIGCLKSHSDGTHLLQSCNFSKYFLMKKTPLHLGWPEGEYIFSKSFFLGGGGGGLSTFLP